MNPKLSKRKRLILAELVRLGGTATTRQIAEGLDLDVNGVSQTLGVMGEFARHTPGEGRAGDAVWRLVEGATLEDAPLKPAPIDNPLPGFDDEDDE